LRERWECRAASDKAKANLDIDDWTMTMTELPEVGEDGMPGGKVRSPSTAGAATSSRTGMVRNVNASPTIRYGIHACCSAKY